MNCPYCNKQIDDNTQFCPHCGQNVEINKTNKTVNTYWSKVNDEDKQRSVQYGVIKKEKKQIKKSRQIKAIIIGIVVVALILGGVIGFISIKTNSDKILEQVKKKLPGKSFTCSDTTGSLLTGYTPHRFKLEFFDDNTVDCYYAKGRSNDKDDKYEFKGNFDYTLNRSIFGTFTFEVDGEVFTLMVDEENNPDYLHFDK